MTGVNCGVAYTAWLVTGRPQADTASACIHKRTTNEQSWTVPVFRETVTPVLSRRVIPRLHDQAGSTSWLYVSWTSQLDVCWTFARSCKRGINHTQRALVLFSHLSTVVVRHEANGGVVYGTRAWFKHATGLSGVVVYKLVPRTCLPASAVP